MYGSNALHAAHTRADTRIQRVDAEVVQQLKLRADHVKNTQHGEACRIRRTVRIERVRARRTRAAIARAQHVCAHDEELVGVECLAWPNKVFPPPLARVPRRARCMRAGRQARMQQDGIITRCIQCAPRLIGNLVRREHAAIVESKGLVTNKGIIARHNVSIRRLGSEHLVLLARGRTCMLTPGHDAALPRLVLVNAWQRHDLDGRFGGSRPTRIRPKRQHRDCIAPQPCAQQRHTPHSPQPRHESHCRKKPSSPSTPGGRRGRWAPGHHVMWQGITSYAT